MLTFVKLGGSVLTDKTRAEAADLPVIRRLAAEVHEALTACPELRLILGHGSGSFGHTYALRYGVHRGIPPGGDWMGFALTAAAALRLNRVVIDELLAAGVPALALQPSTTLRAVNGELATWNTATVLQALDHGLTPVIHGDVAFDIGQGTAIISTEQLLVYLAQNVPDLRPARIILVGEAGVFTADPRTNRRARRIPRINRDNIAAVLCNTGASHGVDVTGGMRSKVELMWRLVETLPGLEVRLIGSSAGALASALQGAADDSGTTIANA